MKIRLVKLYCNEKEVDWQDEGSQMVKILSVNEYSDWEEVEPTELSLLQNYVYQFNYKSDKEKYLIIEETKGLAKRLVNEMKEDMIKEEKRRLAEEEKHKRKLEEGKKKREDKQIENALKTIKALDKKKRERYIESLKKDCEDFLKNGDNKKV